MSDSSISNSSMSNSSMSNSSMSNDSLFYSVCSEIQAHVGIKNSTLSRFI
jgi:hypothetical protein